MVNVANRADVAMWLVAVEFFFAHLNLHYFESGGSLEKFMRPRKWKATQHYARASR
jgi:tetrahydromethanopterin S-methyltransferase subunit D